MKRSARFLLIAAILLSAAGSILSGAVFHVSTSGNDSNDGLSWATAFATVQKGINSANSAGNSEVWVSSGTYYPTECLTDVTGLRTGDAYKTFMMYAGVNVYGGFAGTELSKDARALSGSDPWEFANPTVLDGSTTGSYHVVWFCTNGFYTETYEGVTVYFPSALASQSVMDGFTITGGFANYPTRIQSSSTDAKQNFCHYSGGGVALTGKGELHNCVVQNNKARYSGAGIAMQLDSKVLYCVVENNEGIGANFYNAGFLGIGAFNYWRCDGAGIGTKGSTSARGLIDHCIIRNNLGQSNDLYPNPPSATYNKFNQGGGLCVFRTDVTNCKISSNNIKKNPSSYAGGSGPSCGGGVYMQSNAYLYNCEITDNGFVDNAAQNGAGIFMADEQVAATNYTDLLVKNCYVHTNRAGGAIAYDAGYQQIENTIVANNPGYAVYSYGNATNGRTVNCLIYNNQGGWCNTTNTSNKNHSLINSTVVKNGGYGVLVQNSNAYSISNSLIWGNTNNYAIPATVTINNSAFDYTTMPAGTNLIQLPTTNDPGPVFLNPTTTAGINQADWESASWRIGNTSLCKDAGNNSFINTITTVDINGDPRIQGGTVDLGAYEFTLYTLNLTVADPGTGVALILNNSSTSGTFAPGTPLTIKATPSTDYSFWKWTYDGVTANKISEWTFNMPAENIELSAHFTLDPNAPTSGLPSGNNVPVSTNQLSWTAPASGQAPTNYQVFLYSEADGYTNPIINGIETVNTYYNNIYLDMNTTYLARIYAEYDPDFMAKGVSEPLEWYFKTENIILYTVQLSVDPMGGGLVLIQNNGSATGDFEAGTVLNLTATPDGEYVFWKWTLEGVTVSTSANFTYTVPASDTNLVAHFYLDPNAPTNGTPSGTGISVSTDTIGWTAPASGTVPTNYKVYLYSEADMYTTPIINGAVCVTSPYSGLDLVYGTTYKVQVYSNYDPDAKGMSDPLTWFFTTEEGSLLAPEGLTVTDMTGSLRLDWNACAGADSYRIYSSTDPFADFAAWTLETEVAGVTTWTDSSVSGVMKFYKVTSAR
jgi:hypothetical protein